MGRILAVTGIPDPVQLIVHGALFPRLRDWLEAQGFQLADWPALDDPDDLKTYMVVPSARLWDASYRQAALTAPEPCGDPGSGIECATQGCTHDGPWVEARLGTDNESGGK